MENELEYSLYPLGANLEEVNDNTFKIMYNENFSFENSIDFIYEKMIKHPKLKDIRTLEKRKKIYSILSWISLLVPVLVICIMGIYVLITKKELKLTSYFSLAIIIPLILSSTFYIKSKKNK